MQRARLQFHEHELGDWMRARRAPDVVSPDRTDYGSREYSVRDTEGNLWSFGTYDPDDDR